MRLTLLSIFTSLTIALAADAPDTMHIAVGATEVKVGDIIDVKLTLENLQGTFDQPVWSGFEVVGGPNQASQFQYINGQSFQSISYTYHLRVIESGNLMISPIVIQSAKGDVFETQPISIVSHPDDGSEVQHHRIDHENKDLHFDFFDLQPKKPKRKLKTTRI